MNKIVTLLLLSLSFAAFAQNTTIPMDGKMERKKSDLVLNGRVLSPSEVSKIFSYEDYQTYAGAKSNMSFGNKMRNSFFITLGGFIAWDLIDIAVLNRAPSSFSTSLQGIILNAEFATWIIVKSIGKGRLNYLVDTYNNGQTKNVQYGFAPSVFKLDTPISNGQNLGYGGTFTISF
jgi:hypothetical protein